MSVVDPLDPGRNLAALGLSLARVARRLELPASALLAPVPAVSAWSVGEHLFHLVLACDLSLRNATSLARDEGLLLREPEDKNPEALALLRRGRFPRGVARAPRFVTPPRRIDLALLGRLLAEVRAAREHLAGDLAALSAAPRTIPHQLLGDLDAREWLRFARAHTAHHLLIVREIGRR